jgi:hypothetical protein
MILLGSSANAPVIVEGNVSSAGRGGCDAATGNAVRKILHKAVSFDPDNLGLVRFLLFFCSSFSVVMHG